LERTSPLNDALQPTEMDIQLIVGLGNPGAEYEKTRHNAGFWWVDAIAQAKRAAWKKETKFSGWTTQVEEGGLDFALLKPATYMNESGRSVGKYLQFYKIEPAAMLVVHDELDLAPGAVKLKRGGGTGGHNGLEDLADVLGTKDFWRLRIGIGHPGHKDLVPDYVLKKARREEQELIDPAFERSLGLLPWLAKGRMQDAMAWLHTSPEDEAKRKAALEARKHAAQAGVPAQPDIPSTKEKP
jgi:PTH1 family peptidyl-tRNA hydrolase